MQVPLSIAGRYEKQDIYKRHLIGLFFTDLVQISVVSTLPGNEISLNIDAESFFDFTLCLLGMLIISVFTHRGEP